MTVLHQKSKTKGAYDLAFALSAFALPVAAFCPTTSREAEKNTAVGVQSFRLQSAGSQESQATLSPARISVPKVERPTWTDQNADRFDELAEKAALEEISAAEKVELTKLISLRRVAQCPPDPEEYFAEMVRRRQIRKVLKNLNSCFLLKDGINWQDY